MFLNDEERALMRANKNKEKKAKKNQTKVEKKSFSNEVDEERPGDWCCNRCSNHNYSFRDVCNKCGLTFAEHDQMG